MAQKPKVIVIVGPTASGKTALSLSLAKIFNGEIISADSRQIYRGMDIGTAKALASELNGIKHHLVNIKSPDADYSVGQFKKDAIKAVNKILKAGKLPIIAGGTGLYISALVNNLEFPRIKENKTLRRQIEKDIEKMGLKAVFDRLVELDAEAAYIVDPNNPRRVVRALEVALITGQPFTSQRKKSEPQFDFLQLGVNRPRDILKKIIFERIDQMFSDGLVEEVKILVKKYGEKQKAFDAIGYREVIQFLKKEITLDECKELMKKNTWHYAKRQITWFNKDKRINWLEDVADAEGLVRNFLKIG